MHTPGPWYTWHSEVNGRPAWLVTAVPKEEWTPQHRVVATIYGNDALTQANAAIICKAPSNTKALQAARRALSNPATTVKEEKKSVFDFANLFGDTLQDDLVRARRKSKIEEYATAPMGRVFVSLCIIFSIAWTCFLGVQKGVDMLGLRSGPERSGFQITQPDEFAPTPPANNSPADNAPANNRPANPNRTPQEPGGGSLFE